MGHVGHAQESVTVEGKILKVGGRPFFINGMNWDYIPIGSNYEYDFWGKPESFIKRAIDKEMSLLREMGVNTIRHYTGIPAKWITYIYENYGIYTMLNHSYGRYGINVDGRWVNQTDYSDKKIKELLLGEVARLADGYKDTPGLLLFLLGNENNYALHWGGAATENTPGETSKLLEGQARALYRAFNEAALTIKKIDSSHPVAICNGDLLYLGLIAEECPDVDILGLNIYRGASFGDAFHRVKQQLGKPVILTELGADAFDALHYKEDQKPQAYYLIQNWKEIYQNAPGMGKAGNVLGGFTFQFSDGWWKQGQTVNLDIHDPDASWANGGYEFDFKEGNNNMNEEWFGVCAKVPADEEGVYGLEPREAYYALKKLHQINPYRQGFDQGKIEEYATDVLKDFD